MKLSDKTKKWLIISALGVICIVLVIATFSRFKEKEPELVMTPMAPTVTDTVTPEISAPVLTETPIPKISTVPLNPTVTPTPLPDSGDSDGTEQSIQAEVTKPTQPPEEVKADPTKKPDREKVSTAKEGKDTKKDNSTSNSPTSAPKSGDKKDGKIYVPGFGWVEDNGGGGSGTTADDMYENGNKIGEMN